MMPIRLGSKAIFRVADLKVAVGRERQIVLADLITLGQVGVVVLLAVPLGERGDLAIEGHGGSQRQVKRLAIHHRQRSRADQCTRGTSACSAAPKLRAAPAEQLRPREQLHVNFQADDDCVVHTAIQYPTAWPSLRGSLPPMRTPFSRSMRMP